MNVGVFTLGLSPPIVTETLIRLKERGVRIDRGILLTTDGALPSYQALKIALHWSNKATKFQNVLDEHRIEDLVIDLRLMKLEKDDIERPEDCHTFRVRLSQALKNALGWAGGDPSNVHVSVAGGRKTMPIDAVLVSMAKGIKNVYHIIAPKVPGIAEEFAQFVIGKLKEVSIDGSRLSRDKLLNDLRKYEDRPDEAGEMLVKYSLKVCFPPKDLQYYLVKIPVPSLPSDERKRLTREVLRANVPYKSR